MVLEAPESYLKSQGGYRKAVYILFQWNIDDLEFPRGCCEAMCILFLWNIYGLGISRKLLGNQCWWFGISRKLLWTNLHTFLMKYWWFWNLQEVVGITSTWRALVVDLWGSRSFTAIWLIIYKPAVGINIPVVVVSGVGAPSSRQLTLYWICFIYKSAVGINIMVLLVSGGGAPSSRQVTLQWRRFIYKTAVRIDIMAVVVGGV